VRHSPKARLGGLALLMVAIAGETGSSDASVALFDPTGTTSLQNENVELQLRGDLLGVPRAQLKKSAEVFDFSFVEQTAAELKAENWQPRISKAE